MLHMLKEAYKLGAVKEAIKNPIEENLEGQAEAAASAIFAKYQWEDDYIIQQS